MKELNVSTYRSKEWSRDEVKASPRQLSARSRRRPNCLRRPALSRLTRTEGITLAYMAGPSIVPWRKPLREAGADYPLLNI